MLRHSLRGLAIAALAAVTLVPAPAAAVTAVSTCQPLDKAGETYILTSDITATPGSNAACFSVLADRITVDLAGHTITGPGSALGAGIADGGVNRTSTVVKNGTITNFRFGIFLSSSTRATVRAVNASQNGRGIDVGPTSLVKDCIVQRNVFNGINVGNGGQVEGCLIGGDDGNGNGNFGLAGGDRTLVTRNTVIGNAETGISVAFNSTVTHNTVRDNGGFGIEVLQNSLVSHNTANHNARGIVVFCPSTVTNNQASGNGGSPSDNFVLVTLAGNCFEKGNTSPVLP